MRNEEENTPQTYIDLQIDKLKNAGVKFEKCTESEAREYLAKKCSACKTEAYARLFDIHDKGPNKGKYINLDFVQLKYLADLDQRLREILLSMALDVEHFTKTELITVCAVTEADGYEVMRDYMNSLDNDRKQYIEGEIARHESDPYYQGGDERRDGILPIWSFVEMVSFGTIIGLVRFCGKQRGDSQMTANYFILRSIKSLRNACAHNSCILLNLQVRKKGKRFVSPEVRRALATTILTKHQRERWLQIAPTAQIASLLYLYSEIVPEGSTKKRRIDTLSNFLEDIRKDPILPVKNPAKAALLFIERLTESLNLID